MTTCYGNYISVGRPQTSFEPLNDSIDDERIPSPVHLSSTTSVSSRVSCFSQRLVALDSKKTDHNIRLALVHSKRTDTVVSQIDISTTTQISDDESHSIISDGNTVSPNRSIKNYSKLLFSF